MDSLHNNPFVRAPQRPNEWLNGIVRMWENGLIRTTIGAHLCIISPYCVFGVRHFPIPVPLVIAWYSGTRVL